MMSITATDLGRRSAPAAGRQVLLVEDNPGEASLVRASLAGGRFSLTWASTLEQALAELAVGDFACVLLDLGLPDADGLDALDAALAAAGGTPVVVVTGRDDGALATEAVHRGADDYLLKSELATRLLERSISYAMERAESKAALTRSEAYYRALVGSLGEGLVVQDPSGVIQMTNPAAHQMLGLSEDEITGRTSTDPRWRAIHEDGSPFPGDDHPAMRVLRTGEPVNGVVMGVHKPDGALTWIEINSRPVEITGDGRRCVVTSFRDIAIRRQAQESVRLQAKLLDAVGQAVVATDLGGDVVYWNRAAEALYGWPADEAAGRRFTDLVPSADHEEWAPAIADRLARGESWTGDLVQQRRDGSTFPALVTYTAVLDYTGEPMGAISVSTDVSEREATRAAVERSERQLAEAQAIAHLGSWEWGVDGVLRWSAEVYRIFGRDPERFEPSFSSFLGCVDAEDRAGVEATVVSAAASGERFLSNYRIVRPDGERRWIETHGTPGQDGSGIRFVGTAHDITDRHLAEQALRESERRYRFQAHLLDAVGEAVVATQLDGTITYWGPGAEHLYGWPAADALGRNIHETIPAVPAGGVSPVDIMSRVLSGKSWSGVVQLSRRDGTTFLGDVTDTPVFDGAGNVVAVIGISSDVSEREEAKSRLEHLLAERTAQATEQADVVELGRVALSSASVREVVEQAVTTVARTLGVDRAALLEYRDTAGLVVADAYPNPMPGKSVPVDHAPAWGHALGAPSPVHLEPGLCAEVFGRAGGGAPGVWATITVRHRTYGGLMVRAASPERVFTDHELNFLASVANVIGSVMERDELDQMKSDFVSTVSHELRTPVTSILGYLEVLLSGEIGEFSGEQRRMLGVVERNSRRLMSLIEDLLTVSRIESDRLRLMIRPVEVSELVAAAIQAVGGPMEKRHLELEVDVAPDLPPIAGDCEQLERALVNLLGNAVKFTPDGGRVTLRAGTAGSVVEIRVEDTGIGIPADEQEHLFKRFFRASTARARAVQGTGLGLSIVKSIVEGHHGEVSVCSVPGRGTTVVMAVPRFPAVPECQELAS